MKRSISLILLLAGFVASAQQIGNGFASNISDLTQPIKSGIYQVNSLGLNPDESNSWYHFLVMRHSNESNNHQLQLSSSYSENDKLFFRKLANSSGQNWYEVATRGTNNFSGNQIINGNVGIGTSIPNSRLDLGSGYGINGAKFLIYNDDSTSELSGTKSGFYMDNFTYNNINLVFPEAVTVPGLFTISAKNTAGTTLNPYFSIAGLTGNVGIGTINPKNKLDVNGTIHSKEVKVDMDGWSDFVFKKEYNLPRLEEVEKHIRDKGHLENIPSEEEVLKNGISLGEMNAKLLQKIEEMTLYIIEQNKKTINLESRLEKVEANSK